MRHMNLRERNAVMALRFGLIDWFQYFEIVRSLPIIILAFALTACAGSDKAEEGPAPLTCQTLQGHYYDQYTPSQTLDIAGDCTFTDSVCGYTANYTIPDRATGATVITVAGTNGTPGCMSSTAHMCVLESNGVQLGINCDNGAHLYLFIKQ